MSSAEADAAAGGAEYGNDKKNKKTKPAKSKRQRRKEGPNPSNTWPQQPKIQSADARAKAYLRVAGLGSSSTKKLPSQTLDPTIDLHSPEIKFGRLLGGTDQRKRHEAVHKLQAYLKARCDIDNVKGGISELDLLKLWKAMWFTLYMADKVPVQDELSKRLTELIWCVAGTEEEDEYAGQAYMDMCGGEGDEDVIMEEVENTLEDYGNDEKEEEDAEWQSFDPDNEEEVHRMIEKKMKNKTDWSDESEDGNNKEEEEEEREEVDEELEEEEQEEIDEEQDDSLVRHCRGAHLASLFVKTFFATVRREWGNMDKWRVDKFYTLIRLMMQQVYKYMAIRHWNIGIIRLFNDVLFEEVLSQTPNGLRYHLIDIALEELVNANAKAPMPLTEATFLDCLEPYFAMAQTVQDKLVHKRIMDNVLSKFLTEYSVVSDAALVAEQKGEENLHILDQVHVASVAQFIFELASDAATQDRYRKDLYEMHKMYMKRLKEVGKDVVLDDMDEASDAFGAEVEAVGDDDERVERNTKQGKRKHAEKKERGSEEVTENPVESSEQAAATKKEHKKKKRKRKKRSHEEAEEDVGAAATPKLADTAKPEGPSHAEEHADSSDHHKKKRKKKTHEKAQDGEGAAGSPNLADASMAKEPSQADEHGESTGHHKKKKKKDKNRMKTEDADEEVITISVSEQKNAAKAAKDEDTASAAPQGETKKRGKAKKKKSKHSKKKDADTDEKEKRVSFGKANRSKSYKASMKALTTMEQPSTALRTPDRSILLKKLESDEGVVKRKSRPKATDYF